MTSERRAFSRMNSKDETYGVLVRNDKEQRVEVIDQSIGGLKLRLLSPIFLAQGQQCFLHLRNEKFIVSLRYVDRDLDGNLIVGVAWEKPSGVPERIMLNSYVESQGLNLICYSIGQVSPETDQICLWNREEFEISRNELNWFTESERMDQLRDEAYLDSIKEVYQMSAEISAEEVLNFEF